MSDRDPVPAAARPHEGAWWRRRRRALAAMAALVLLAAIAFALACRREDRSRPFDSGGAYIQDVRTDAATIAVLSATPVRLEVEARPLRSDAEAQPERAAVRASEPAPRTIHALRLGGLAADTRYRYRVREVGGALLTEATLRTAPPPGRRAIRIVALGDSGRVKHERRRCPLGLGDRAPDRGGAQAAVVAEILRHGTPDLLLLLGDIVYNRGERRRYHEAFFEPFRPLIERVPAYAAIGNHDAKTERAAPLLEAFHLPTSNGEAGATERYYRFSYGDARLICLDTETSALEPQSAQYRWLEAELRRGTPLRWTIVFMHRPPLSDGKHGDDERLSTQIAPLFARYGVDLVLAGHDHNYQRFHPIDGVTYVIAGGGGNRLYSVRPSARLAAYAKAHCFVEITLDAERLRGRVWSVRGELLDAF